MALGRRGSRAAVRSLAVCLAVGTAAGAVIGGTLGRASMRLVFVADRGMRGFETSAGATVGQFTAGGTLAVYAAGLFVGLLLGLAYWVARPFLPGTRAIRAGVYTTAATLLGTALVVGDARQDFAFVPPALSVALIVVGIALTALPVPLIAERLAPSATRLPLRASLAVVAVVLVVLAAYAGLRVADALDELRLV